MKVVWLKDTEEGTVDAVIVSNVTSAKEIEKCIQKTKNEKAGDWQWEDIIECLPLDCIVYDRWNNAEAVYY